MNQSNHPLRDDVELRIGKGLISGYGSALLGGLSLCGVLCFRFPAILTSEQFRAAYTQEFVRTLLFWTLVAAYVSGIISYALNQSKVLAWIGIGSAFAASLLGGSRITVSPFASTPYSFGTYRCPKGRWPGEYGVISGEPPLSFLLQFTSLPALQIGPTHAPFGS